MSTQTELERLKSEMDAAWEAEREAREAAREAREAAREANWAAREADKAWFSAWAAAGGEK